MKKMLSWWHLKWVNILTVHGEGVEGAPLAILQMMMDLELSSVIKTVVKKNQVLLR